MNFKTLPIALALFLFANTTNGQQKSILERVQHRNINTPANAADSLIAEFENSIYNCFYNPKFWSKSNTPTFTVLKIDINKLGKVKNIRFSDSADTVFVNAFTERPKYHDYKATLEKYAKIKLYRNISMLIPVSFEPLYGPIRSLNFDKIESLMKFDKKDLTGKIILLPAIRIKVLPEHNM